MPSQPPRSPGRDTSQAVCLPSEIAGQSPSDAGSVPLIRRLLAHLVSEDLAQGTHLTEQGLADVLQMSRSAVRRTLVVLQAVGIVEKIANRGYFLARPAGTLFDASLVPAFDEDGLFERVALDHLRGLLPSSFSEEDIASRYEVSVPLARRAVEALDDENVIMPDETGGWRFNPFLLSSDASLASYSYRLATEPQIPLLSTFSVRRELIRACRDEHIRLLSVTATERTGRLAFRVDAAFHEAIATCGGNPFFHAGVVQHNRMRQLLEYRDAPDEERMLVWLREHLDILDAIVARDFREASDLMRVHLVNAMHHRERAPLPPPRSL